MDLLLHFKVNEGDENNINIQEYMLYGDVETKSEKCLVDEGDEVVLTEFPVPEFKNCTLMKKGDEGFYEYKDYRQGENAELAGGYAVSGILQQNKRFDFNYVNDQINGIVQDPFYKVETMGDQETGTAEFLIRYGTTYIKESSAPQGYKLSDEVVKVKFTDEGLFVNDKEVHVDNNHRYSIVYQNVLLPSVNTGTAKNKDMMYMMLGVVIIALGASIATVRKIRKSED